MKRSIKVTFRVTANEQKKLQANAKKSGYSQEAYLRSLITGYIPKELPPLDYYAMVRELKAIGNNLNQIAKKTHELGRVDAVSYQRESEKLNRWILEIQDAAQLPEKLEKV